jgi:hypothetical protein
MLEEEEVCSLRFAANVLSPHHVILSGSEEPVNYAWRDGWSNAANSQLIPANFNKGVAYGPCLSS